MRFLLRLMPRSIVAQITGSSPSPCCSASRVAGDRLASCSIRPAPHDDHPIFAADASAEITRLVRAAKSPAEVDTLLAAIQRGGLDVRRVALTDLVADRGRCVFRASGDAAAGGATRHRARAACGTPPARRRIIVRLDDAPA